MDEAEQWRAREAVAAWVDTVYPSVSGNRRERLIDVGEDALQSFDDYGSMYDVSFDPEGAAHAYAQRSYDAEEPLRDAAAREWRRISRNTFPHAAPAVMQRRTACGRSRERRSRATRRTASRARGPDDSSDGEPAGQVGRAGVSASFTHGVNVPPPRVVSGRARASIPVAGRRA